MKSSYLVVIPAYNEEATIEEVVSLTQPYADVCVVDDASTDSTPEILARLKGVHTIRHKKNTHIAGAILDGMRYALSAGYDFCITMDAGLSHDPRVLPEFMKHGSADLVIGMREKTVNVPFYRRLLSRAGTFVINLALNRGRRKKLSLRDATSGYRMYSRKALLVLLTRKMRSRSFDFHLEALARVARGGDLRIEEVPITYVYSNSSLKLKIVGEALRTWWRIWVEGRGPLPPPIRTREDSAAAKLYQ
jgi:dolichol-phosphate mannosyltransferase